MTDADLQALWSAWFKDRTLHRGCNLISAIVRGTVERTAGNGAPASDKVAEGAAAGSDDRGHFSNVPMDPAGTDPEPRPGITHGPGSPIPRLVGQDDFGRRKPGNGAKIIEGLQDAVAYAQGDATAARVRAAAGMTREDVPPRRTAYLDSGPGRPTGDDA